MTNTWCPELYKKAWNFATRAHAGQTYGGALDGERVPYINHIASVAMEVTLAAVQTQQDFDVDLAVQCALLHDVIEDTEVKYDAVRAAFGEDVANGVLALSKDKSLPGKPEQMADSLRRIRLQPKEVWMVKLADRITNLYHPPFYWDNAKIMKYQKEAQEISAALSTANTFLANRLAGKIDEYPKFAKS